MPWTLRWVAALVGLGLAGLAIGPVPLGPAELAGVLLEPLGWGEGDPLARTVVLQLRAPRVLLAALVGASLGLAGALTQTLFRNPLADPGLLGVSSGAALAVAALLVLAGGAPVAVQGLVAFLGGWLALAGLRLLSAGGGVLRQVLAGVAINAGAGAGTGLLLYLGSDEALRSFTFWTLGSLASASPAGCALAAAGLVGAGLALWGQLAALDASLLGDETAQSLGVSLAAQRARATGAAALLLGLAVALSGIIGFVGLVIPHLVRAQVGPAHARLLPQAALAGAVLLVAADGVARTVAAPAEVPIGLLTALLGAPFLLALVRKGVSG